MTVHHPDGPPGADVLDGGPAGPAWSRRAVAALALVAVVVLVAGALLQQERRSAAAQERRAAGAVDLVLLPTSGVSGWTETGGGSLEVQLQVRNDGPRQVEVAGASWTGFALVRPVQLPVGGERQVPVRLAVDCREGRPGLLSLDDDVELQVRTATSVRTVRLPLPDAPIDAGEADAICGFVPLDDALLVLDEREVLRGTALVLELRLSVQGSRPVDLVRLGAGPGLGAVLLERVMGAAATGPARPLPVALPLVEPRRPRGATYEVAVRVTDCAAVPSGPDTATLTLGTGDEQGGTAELVLPYDPALRAELLAASCAG